MSEQFLLLKSTVLLSNDCKYATSELFNTCCNFNKMKIFNLTIMSKSATIHKNKASLMVSKTGETGWYDQLPFCHKISTDIDVRAPKQLYAGIAIPVNTNGYLIVLNYTSFICTVDTSTVTMGKWYGVHYQSLKPWSHLPSKIE